MVPHLLLIAFLILTAIMNTCGQALRSRMIVSDA
ncbi:hypothetical protein BH10BAC6_BH10BAC6_17750 [soil metagenome]